MQPSHAGVPGVGMPQAGSQHLAGLGIGGLGGGLGRASGSAFLPSGVGQGAPGVGLSGKQYCSVRRPMRILYLRVKEVAHAWCNPSSVIPECSCRCIRFFLVPCSWLRRRINGNYMKTAACARGVRMSPVPARMTSLHHHLL